MVGGEWRAGGGTRGVGHGEAKAELVELSPRGEGAEQPSVADVHLRLEPVRHRRDCHHLRLVAAVHGVADLQPEQVRRLGPCQNVPVDLADVEAAQGKRRSELEDGAQRTVVQCCRVAVDSARRSDVASLALWRADIRSQVDDGLRLGCGEFEVEGDLPHPAALSRRHLEGAQAPLPWGKLRGNRVAVGLERAGWYWLLVEVKPGEGGGSALEPGDRSEGAQSVESVRSAGSVRLRFQPKRLALDAMVGNPPRRVINPVRQLPGRRGVQVHLRQHQPHHELALGVDGVQLVLTPRLPAIEAGGTLPVLHAVVDAGVDVVVALPAGQLAEEHRRLARLQPRQRHVHIRPVGAQRISAVRLRREPRVLRLKPQGVPVDHHFERLVQPVGRLVAHVPTVVLDGEVEPQPGRLRPSQRTLRQRIQIERLPHLVRLVADVRDPHGEPTPRAGVVAKDGDAGAGVIEGPVGGDGRRGQRASEKQCSRHSEPPSGALKGPAIPDGRAGRSGERLQP